MVRRKVYKMNESGMIAITIPGKLAKEWGIIGLQEINLDKIAPGRFRFCATIGEINRLGIGKEEVDNSPGIPDNEG